MAAFDIMPFTSAHGGHTRVIAYPVNTAATFLVGEPVQIEAAGTIIESATLPTPVASPPTLAGIAAASAASLAALNNWGSTTLGANVLAPVYDLNDDVEWISNNLMTSVETNLALTYEQEHGFLARLDYYEPADLATIVRRSAPSSKSSTEGRPADRPPTAAANCEKCPTGSPPASSGTTRHAWPDPAAWRRRRWIPLGRPRPIRTRRREIP